MSHSLYRLDSMRIFTSDAAETRWPLKYLHCLASEGKRGWIQEVLARASTAGVKVFAGLLCVCVCVCRKIVRPLDFFPTRVPGKG